MPLGEPGEMVFRGPVVVQGYWNKPGETAGAFRDGWFYTGDIGYLDEDQFCYIVDRKKDMIICSGFNVYPREIDEVLYTHPKVLEAGAVGIPDEKRGETVKVFVVAKPGEHLTEEDIIQYCRQYLAPYKVPKSVEFIDALPRTSVKKVDRKALRARDLG
jgi:long-chain acyl-CoA synthetase